MPTNSLQTTWWSAYSQRRFSILLLILLSLLAGSPALVEFALPPGWFEVLMSLLILAAILSLCVERRQRGFALLLGVPTILLSLIGHTLPAGLSRWVVLCGHLCEVAFLLGAAGLVIRSLFRTDSLSFDSILGAVCGYLFLGLAWAVCYSMIENSQPGSLELGEAVADSDRPRPLPDQLIYYSFVTLTTVGYGDVHPISPPARTLAWLEALTGQFYLAVIVAGVVSLMVASNRRRDDES